MPLLLPNETQQGISFSNEGPAMVDVHCFRDDDTVIKVTPAALPDLIGETDGFTIVHIDGELELPPIGWSPNARRLLILTQMVLGSELARKD